MMFRNSNQPGWQPTSATLWAEIDAARAFDEQARVVRFRFERLVLAGYDNPRASKLAEDLSFAWHVAVGLLESGCDARTAEAVLL